MNLLSPLPRVRPRGDSNRKHAQSGVAIRVLLLGEESPLTRRKSPKCEL